MRSLRSYPQFFYFWRGVAIYKNIFINMLSLFIIIYRVRNYKLRLFTCVIIMVLHLMTGICDSVFKLYPVYRFSFCLIPYYIRRYTDNVDTALLVTENRDFKKALFGRVNI